MKRSLNCIEPRQAWVLCTVGGPKYRKVNRKKNSPTRTNSNFIWLTLTLVLSSLSVWPEMTPNQLGSNLYGVGSRTFPARANLHLRSVPRRHVSYTKTNRGITSEIDPSTRVYH